MKTTKKTVKPGEAFKVKSTPITREFGFRVYGQSAADCKAWPGEVGVVVERKWTAASNGQPMSGLWLEFSRGRSVSLGSDEQFFNGDAEYLIRVKK